RPGGKIGEIESHGFRFDTGPSLLTMPSVLESFFLNCGHSIHNFLSIEPVDPICRYFFNSGVEFDCHRKEAVNIAQIQNFAPQDVQAYQDFLKYSQELYQRTKESFLFNPLYGWSDFRSLNWTDFSKIDAFKTVAQRIEKQFNSPELQQFFERFPTYNGSSPYQAPATMNIIPYIALNRGGYYIKGGIYRLVDALINLADSMEVSIKTDIDIQSVTTQNNSVTGVKDSQGRQYHADIVVSNADAHITYRQILNSNNLSHIQKKKLDIAEPSSSAFVLLLGVERQYSQLSHHNIFFSDDYRNEFKQIFTKKIMPDNPTIYISNTSHSDPDHAPEGASNLFILVNAPYVNENWYWQNNKEKYRDKVIQILEKRGLIELKKHITFSKTLTPKHFFNRYRSYKGSIYGTSSNSKWSAFLRPRNKSRKIEGLYLVGGSTHPGGGIPLVLLSALHATELIQRYE